MPLNFLTIAKAELKIAPTIKTMEHGIDMKKYFYELFFKIQDLFNNAVNSLNDPGDRSMNIDY
jgi:hypothetical protein